MSNGKFPKLFKVGETVFFSDAIMGIVKGTIENISLKSEIAYINCGSLNFEIPFSSLFSTKAAAQKSK